MTGSHEAAGGVRTQALLMIVVVFLVGAFAGGAFERMSHRGARGGLGGSGRMWGGGRGGTWRAGRNAGGNAVERLGLDTPPPWL